MTQQPRLLKGRLGAGQFAENIHTPAALTLSAPAPVRPEMADYDIPAPLESQKFLDGSRIPEGASFEEAYEEFFRPLEQFEAAHGMWEKTRPPSEEQLRDLAGLTGVNLGRTAGIFVEADEATGDPVIALTTRNGNSRVRECTADSDVDCMKCNACIQEHLIPGLPTHVRDEDDNDGDNAYVTSYFRPTDPAAAARYLTDQKTREVLNHRTWARDAISSGKQPPWSILTPARDREERQNLGVNLSYAKSLAARKSGDAQYARELIDLVETGTPVRNNARYPGALMDTAGYAIYGEAVTKHQAEAARLRQEAASLEAELSTPLPPAITALVNAETARLAQAIVQEDDRTEDSRTRLEKSKRSIRLWANELLREDAKLNAAVEAAEADIAAFEWSSSWPGDPAGCPPRPAD